MTFSRTFWEIRGRNKLKSSDRGPDESSDSASKGTGFILKFTVHENWAAPHWSQRQNNVQKREKIRFSHFSSVDVWNEKEVQDKAKDKTQAKSKQIQHDFRCLCPAVNNIQVILEMPKLLSTLFSPVYFLKFFGPSTLSIYSMPITKRAINTRCLSLCRCWSHVCCEPLPTSFKNLSKSGIAWTIIFFSFLSNFLQGLIEAQV